MRVRWAVPFLLALLAACSSTGSSVKVDYYSIGGRSIAGIDREIKRRGPRIGGTGHAVAVARIRIQPRYATLASGGRCSTRNVKVDVNARVTLPRWRNRRQANRELAAAWDNIDRYTRLHEAVHVAIAFRYARDLEKSIAALTAPTCARLQEDVSTLVTARLDAHDRAQRKFDTDEQRRIRAIARQQAAAS